MVRVPALLMASRRVEHKNGDNVCGQSWQVMINGNGWLRFFDCNLRHDFCRQRPTLLGRWVGRVGGWVVFLCLASKVVSTQADRKRDPGRSPACAPPVCRRDPHPSCHRRLEGPTLGGWVGRMGLLNCRFDNWVCKIVDLLF